MAIGVALAYAAWGAALSRYTGSVGTAASRESRVGTWLLLWTAIAVPAFFYAKSVLSTPIWNDRNLLMVVPSVLVLVAIALTQPRLPLLWTRIGGAMVLGAMLFQLTITLEFYTKSRKENFRGAADVGARWLRKDTSAKVVCLSFRTDYFEYYLRRFGTEPEIACSPREEKVLELIDAAFQQTESVILLYGHFVPKDPTWAALADRYEVQEEVRLRKAGAVRLARKD